MLAKAQSIFLQTANCSLKNVTFVTFSDILAEAQHIFLFTVDC